MNNNEGTTDERQVLSLLIGALRRFNQFDNQMQVSTILTLLEIAHAESFGKDISVQDIEKNVGLYSGTASRNVYYWGEGHKAMKGGHEMITVNFDPNDRRKRSLRMTNKGHAFIGDIVNGVKAYGATARNQMAS
jgi:DNA-binding MarR family transcriptional regulator